MANFYAGETILIEDTIQRKIPFGTAADYDPASGAKISIFFGDIVVVNSQPMTKNATGKYYYLYQSVVGKSGKYHYEILADDTTYDSFIEGEFKLL